jgi:pimeloyl-ACP methyl ester carboxylesterase
MRRIVLCFAAAAMVASAGFAEEAGPHVVGSQVTRIGRFVRTDWTVQVGANPVNRFTVHRLTMDGAAAEERMATGGGSSISSREGDGGGGRGGAARAALVLLPPLGNAFNFFEVDENGVYERSFAAFFASRGFEVWGYSPRTTGLHAGVCESGAIDCAPMAHWGVAAVVEDAAFLRGFLARASGEDLPVYVGGFSLGGMTTIATINAHPEDYAGAFVLEGALYSADPSIRALNAGYCSGLEAQLAAGQIFDDTTLPGIRGIVGLAAANPHGPTPLPGFPPGTTNHQVMVFLLAVPQPGPLWPTHDFVRCAGSVPEDRFFFSTDPRVIAHSLLFSDYVDNLAIRDISCSLAGERTFTAHLGDFTAPLYLLGGGLGFLAQEVDMTHIIGSTDITRNFVPAFGHADHWFSANHRQILEGDLLRWLDRVRHED